MRDIDVDKKQPLIKEAVTGNLIRNEINRIVGRQQQAVGLLECQCIYQS